MKVIIPLFTTLHSRWEKLSMSLKLSNLVLSAFQVAKFLLLHVKSFEHKRVKAGASIKSYFLSDMHSLNGGDMFN